MKKVLIAEMDQGLGPMAKARLTLIGLASRDVALVKTPSEAMDFASNHKKSRVRVAIIGHLAHYGGLVKEQELIDTLKSEVPGVVIVSCTGGEMLGADIAIKRPEGYLEIEEVVKKALARRKV